MVEEKLLVKLDEFLGSGVHIGMKFRTKFMSEYIYKIRPDGLSVLNIQLINNKIEVVSKFLSKFEPGKILVASKRECGHSPVKKFAELTGAKAIVGRYPPGALTNPDFPGYIEPSILFVADPRSDKNVLRDALKVGIPIIALCDTNNTTNNLDLMIPCNNKSKKSIAFIFWVLAKEFLKNKKQIKKDEDFKTQLSEFEG